MPPVAAPAAPAAAPGTPAPSAPTRPASALDAVIGNTLAAMRETPAPETPPRNELGQFTAEQQQPAGDELEETPTGEEAAAPAPGEEAEPLQLPEGFSAAPALPPERAKGFKVYDHEGEIVAPDLEFEFTANGKTRKVSTDQLIRYAQAAFPSIEREQALEVERQSIQRQQVFARELQQTALSLQEQVQQRDQMIERLLGDPNFLANELVRFEQQNTPEARAERERQRLNNERQQWHFQQAAQASQAFVDNELSFAVTEITKAFPTVTPDELASKLFLAADPYRVQGPGGRIIHPDGFTALREFVTKELVPWAQQAHFARSDGRPAAAASESTAVRRANAETDQARVRAQKAKRVATAALRPAGRAMPESQPAKPVRTMRDAEDAVIGNTLAAMRGG